MTNKRGLVRCELCRSFLSTSSQAFIKTRKAKRCGA